LQPLHQHRAARHLRHLGGQHHAFGRLAGQVDRAQVQPFGAKLVEPEQRHLREQLALARNGLAHDDVKGTDTVAGHHQDAVIPTA
jgi:tRNA isopentenyl-2-thiomethyl-A-37 hydroxylase MiaE